MKTVLDLYELLPAVYRLEDARRGEPLKGLLAVVSEQMGILKRSVDGLWDDFFIETCERWVIPYIGELVANNPLHDADPRGKPDTAAELFDDLAGPDLFPAFAVRLRPDVAKTIYYRRRKGTVPMLEELARDVTGWGAHGVEFFELLEWSQHLNHLRLGSHEGNELRRIEPVDRVNGPFDRLSHTADLRRIQSNEGWYNIKNIGFFLWRLGSYPLRNVPAREADQPWRFHFSPLGNPAPLFTFWRREGDEAGLATELHVPGPIRPAFLFDDLDRYRNLTPPPTRPPVTDLYGPLEDDRSFLVVRNGAAVAPSQDPNAPPTPPGIFQPQIVCMRLDPWPAVQPVGRLIAVDPARGRLAVGDGWGNPTDTLDVFYHYGFSADLGGGPYDRRKWLLRRDLPDTLRFRVKEDGIVPPGEPPATHTSVTAALAAWQLHPELNTVIEILDSRTYALPGSIQLRNGHWLALEAANGQRPLLQTVAAGFDVQVAPPPGPNDRREAELTLSGVVVEGFLNVTGDLGRLRLLHSTLVPGRTLNPVDGRPVGSDPSLIAEAAAGPNPINLELRVEIAFSITGPLRLPRDARGLWLLDSIVDGTRVGAPPVQGTAIAATGTNDQPGPPAVIERTTIFGPSWLKKLTLGSEVIFTHPVTVTQRQEGCVRFSYVPLDSLTPRRYRCQPDLAVEQAGIGEAERVVPDFTDLYYGLPGYAQLRLGVPSEIRKGAEDGSEMGAFSHLKQPQRETNLRIRLDEYLPFGLEPGLIYVT